MDRKPRDLLRYWETTAAATLTPNSYAVRLPVEDAAKLEALAHMYPQRTLDQLISDLLATALHELEEAMPYVKGDKVVALDELGDEIYNDAGLTPKFQRLAQERLARLRANLEAHSQAGMRQHNTLC